MNIAIDVDGTLNNLLGIWLEKYNRSTGENLQPEQITEWDVTKFVTAENREHLLSFLHQEETYAEAAVQPHSQDVVRWLHQVPYVDEVFTISALVPDGSGAKGKMGWLAEHFPFVKPQNRFFGEAKELVDADILIDDYHKNAERFVNRKNRWSILLSAPHNQKLHEHVGKDAASRIIKVNSWLDIPQAIETIQERLEPRT